MMMTIINLKGELKKVRGEYENLMKYVRLLSLETQSLEDVQSIGKQRNNHKDLSYDGDQSSSKGKAQVFVRATHQKYLDDVGESLNYIELER